MSENMKEALFLPLLKELTLTMNFQNILGLLPDISKLVELVVDSQFEIYMVENYLNDPMQFAYRKYHST